jgi:hypothetical protein
MLHDRGRNAYKGSLQLMISLAVMLFMARGHSRECANELPASQGRDLEHEGLDYCLRLLSLYSRVPMIFYTKSMCSSIIYRLSLFQNSKCRSFVALWHSFLLLFNIASISSGWMIFLRSYFMIPPWIVLG